MTYPAPLPSLGSLLAPMPVGSVGQGGNAAPFPWLSGAFAGGSVVPSVRRWSTIRGSNSIKASDLSSRIVIQQRTNSVDAAGQESMTWATWATVWANVRRMGARDFEAAGQPQASGMVSVVIRYRDGITPGMRVMCDGQSWDIVGEPVPLSAGLLRFEAQSGVRSAV